jgi:two-component system chemotaxis sensor kinase CheA
VSEARSELDRLLAGEIERWLRLVGRADAPLNDLRAALHSLKGSTGLAGYPDLALLIGQVSTRLRAGDPDARDDLLAILELAHGRLVNGESALPTTWPEPPPGFCPSPVDVRYQAEYWTAMRDRLGQIDAVLASRDSALAGLEQAQRSVHAMKGAAGAVGDDVTTWYCHGLEARLRAAVRTEASARDVLVELGRHRALLALMIEDSGRGLAALEALARAEASGRRPPSVYPRARADGESGRRARAAARGASEPPVAASFHLQASALDRLLERLDRVELVQQELGQASQLARRVAARLREVRSSVSDALRVLGPARPWGPPLAAVNRLESAATALRSITGSAERGALSFRQNADFLRARAEEMRDELLALRRTRIGSVFERVGEAALRLAETEGKLLRVDISGSHFTIDRRVADRLYDALLQLARNAVAHGIQRPEARTPSGKAAAGTLWLRAERQGEWLRVAVEDDGQGADVERIRHLAVERGALSFDSARDASENQLLSLLFIPGLTTHGDPGLLAGRGLGLDLVQEAARAIGGIARLENREGGGLTAVFEIPRDQALMEVLWVEDGEFEFALPVNYARSVRPANDDHPAIRLSRCLGSSPRGQAGLEVELGVYGVDTIAIGVDRTLDIEEVTVRPLPALLASAGPFCGAILRADGSLRLALDVPVLVARAFAAEP